MCYFPAGTGWGDRERKWGPKRIERGMGGGGRGRERGIVCWDRDGKGSRAM